MCGRIRADARQLVGRARPLCRRQQDLEFYRHLRAGRRRSEIYRGYAQGGRGSRNDLGNLWRGIQHSRWHQGDGQNLWGHQRILGSLGPRDHVLLRVRRTSRRSGQPVFRGKPCAIVTGRRAAGAGAGCRNARLGGAPHGCGRRAAAADRPAAPGGATGAAANVRTSRRRASSVAAIPARSSARPAR